MKKILFLIGKIVGILGVTLFLLMIIIKVRDQKPSDNAVFNNSAARHIFNERDKAKLRVGMMSINSFKPESFDFFFEFIQGNGNIKPGGLGRYIDYYKRIAEYYPHVVGGRETLGFCYYYLGKKEKAQEAYNQAIKSHPDFFWPYYNLGIIYFQDGRYEKSLTLLRRAVRCSPSETLKKMYTSRSYGEILRHSSRFNYAVDQSLKESYQNSYKLIALGELYQKKSPDTNGKGLLKKKGINVRLF